MSHLRILMEIARLKSEGAMINLRQYAAFALAICTVLSCKPAEGPPPDLLKTQREALQKAKAVEGQSAKQAEEQKKAVDEETK